MTHTKCQNKKLVLNLFFSPALLLCPFLFCGNLFAQEAVEDANDVAPSQTNQNEYSSLVAMTSNDYIVTEGDVYSLTFFANNQAVEYNTIIDSAYRLKVANLATISAKGKNFSALKNEVESIVTKNYSFSAVQFLLQKPSVFKVTVSGEAKTTKEKTAWALTRLSDVIYDNFTDFSSRRFVTVIDKNGKQNTYDLFKASRFADMSQNPYLRPNDKIILNKIDRQISIHGAVQRQGSYELSKGENLNKLIEYYGEGFNDFADTSRIKITRYNIEENKYQEIYVSGADLKNDFSLQKYDSVYVYSVNDLQPLFFLEGAVVNSEDSEPVFSKKAIRFREGANYASYFRENKTVFSIYADLENAIIIRKNDSDEEEEIPIDIFSFLVDITKPCEQLILPYDKVVIPFKQTLPLLPIF